MSPLYLYNGKLLVENGALANNINCCCSTGCPTPPCTGIICSAQDLYGEIDCNRAGIHKHTITIPDEYTLPVPINITGSVDDDLLIDGQSASTTYEPGSYIEPNTGCVQAHTIGDQPGPFKDPVHGGITFPMNNRTFEVAARDTLLSVHAFNITICIDPDNTQNVCLPVIVSGCCNSGVELYCYEKTISVPADPPYDCVTRICATGIPEGEDWSQVGGPYDCGCEDCSTTGNCLAYTDWKIIDQNNYVYASGDIRYDGGNGLLDDLPNPFIPLFYGSVGEKNFKLQGYCSGGTWHNLEPWDGTIVLCSGLDDRYPSQALNGPWAPQGDCSKPVNENGDFVCDIGGQFSSDCPSLMPGTLGDGQAWRDPQPGPAYIFTGAVDGEWTNLNNWQDSAGLSPAASLPDANSSVTINAPVTSVPSDYTISVDSLTVNGNGVIYVWINTNSLTVYGKIGCASPICNSEAQTVVGTVVVNGSTSVFDGGVLEGFVSAQFATTIFNNNAYIQAIGWTECDDLNRNCGYLLGDAEFNTGSFNDGYISPNNNGVVFNDNTQNRRCADGMVTFNDFSSNTSTGTVVQGGIFNDGSANDGTVGIATFNDNSFNNTSGTVNGNANFNLNSRNKGTVTGTATFSGSSCNDGGTATTFIPDPPPVC